MFCHSITKFYQAICNFSRQSDRKKKRVVLFTHKRNIICNQTQLDETAHEQTISCRQLFAGHVVGFRPMKRKNKLHGMINTVLSDNGLIVQLVALREMIVFGNFSATFEVLGKFKPAKTVSPRENRWKRRGMKRLFSPPRQFFIIARNFKQRL